MDRSHRPHRAAAFAAFGLLATLALATSSCSRDDAVLAQVGDRKITAGEFKDLSHMAADRYMMPPDSAKARLLDDLIQRELLLVAAHSTRAMTDSELAARRKDVEEDALARAFVTQLAPADVGVSDAEVRTFYTQRGMASHVQIVFVPTASAARAANDALKRGEDFGSVATRFDAAGILPPNGDVGFVQPGMLVSPIDQIVRDAPVGSITGPVEAPGQGWFIVHIVAREPREQAPIEVEGPQLRGMLAQRKQRAYTLKRYQELADEYQVSTNPEGIAVLFDKFGVSQQARAMGGEVVAPDLTPEQRAIVLGRWDGGSRYRGTYTLGEAERDIQNRVGGNVDGRMLPAFEQWVRGRILQHVAILEARRRHIDEDPAMARRVRETVNNEMLQAVYQKEVVSKAAPTDADIRAEYEKNLEAFSTLRSAKLQYMTLPDSQLAVRAIEHVREAPSLKDAVLLSSAGMRVQEEQVTFPAHDPLWIMLQGTLVHAPAGTYLGPYHTPEGWRIVYVADRNVDVTPYEKLDPAIVDGLRQQAMAPASERRLAALTDSLRRTVPVTVDRKLLQQLSWPMPELQLPG